MVGRGHPRGRLHGPTASRTRRGPMTRKRWCRVPKSPVGAAYSHSRHRSDWLWFLVRMGAVSCPSPTLRRQVGGVGAAPGVGVGNLGVGTRSAPIDDACTVRMYDEKRKPAGAGGPEAQPTAAAGVGALPIREAAIPGGIRAAARPRNRVGAEKWSSSTRTS